MTEIEIKAHVGDHEITEKTIASFATFTGETHKRDTYWTKENPPMKVRLREESGLLTVTYKKKELRGAVEVNDEREFTISDRSAFEALITDAGFMPASHKEKRTKRWVRPVNLAGVMEIGIELSHVHALGWFLELEALAEKPDERDIERVRESLMETLTLCGIDSRAIETRYYTEMLAEAGGES